MASALTLPVTNVMATSALIMGGASFTSSITNWDLCSLISTVVGLLIYGFSGDEYVAASGKPGAEGGSGSDGEASQVAMTAGHSDEEDNEYDSDGGEFEDGDDDDEDGANGFESDGAMPANACTGCPCCAACLACFFDDPADAQPSSSARDGESANHDITIQQLGGSPLLSASERRQQRQQRHATASTTAASADTDATAAAAEGGKRRRRRRRANVFVGKFGGAVFMAPQRVRDLLHSERACAIQASDL